MGFFRKQEAPELVGNGEWLNSKPLTLKGLRGHVVLLDFWTYSCINCLRTLPALRAMHSKYKGKDVVIIGIHTPEFDFERDLANVSAAVQRHRIKYPVLNDPTRTNWERYGNRFWPRAALIGRDGNIILEHAGEAGYDKIDERIQQELGIKGPPISEERRRYDPNTSPETYAGSNRNEELGSGIVCTPKGCKEFADIGEHMHDTIYLQGEWVQKQEYLEFKGNTGHILFKYNAKEVNVVMAGSGTAEVIVDGSRLRTEMRGNDVRGSSVKIDRPDMYNLVSAQATHSAELKIIPFKGLKVFAYTFG